MHMKKKSANHLWHVNTIVFMYLFILTGTAFSQGEKTPFQIKGTITDATSGAPLAGASITTTDNSKGTVSDSKGTFSISAAGDAVLKISFTGYVSQSIPVNNRSTISIALAQDMASLNDVVVVGYGTQKKVNLTGAVSQVSGSELTKKTTNNIQQALQGKYPG